MYDDFRSQDGAGLPDVSAYHSGRKRGFLEEQSFLQSIKFRIFVTSKCKSLKVNESEMEKRAVGRLLSFLFGTICVIVEVLQQRYT